MLPELTAEDLKEMGVAAVGHRRKLLAAIAALRGPPPPAPVAEPPPAASRRPRRQHSRRRRPAVAEPAGAERRPLAVLFCDLAGSTALSARLDPEDLREVMAAYHRTVAVAVGRQGGYVAKLLGDFVLAYFGWPWAREGDWGSRSRPGSRQPWRSPDCSCPAPSISALRGLQSLTPGVRVFLRASHDHPCMSAAHITGRPLLCGRAKELSKR